MTRALTSALIGVLCIAASSASAMNCANRDAIATALSLNYGETPISGSLQGDNRIVEVFVSPEDNTWMILVTKTSGKSCIVAAGTNWAQESLLPAGIPG